MSDRTALVTGGAGFIGSRLSRDLVAAGFDVVVADVLHPQVHAEPGWPAALAPGVRPYPVDVTSPTQCDALVRLMRPDLVVHLAAETGTGQSLTEASRHALVNVAGTAQILDAFTRTGHVPEHIVLTSSRAVYGEGRWATVAGTPFYAATRGTAQLDAHEWNPTDRDGTLAGAVPCPHRAEDTEPRPSNVYAATKLAQEHLLGAWTSAMGSTLSILRLQNVYGPGQSLSNPYTGIVSLFATRGLRGEAIEVYEEGGILRDFVYIDDVVRAIMLCVDRPDTGLLLTDIGSGNRVSLLEVAEFVAERTGSPAPVLSTRYRPGDVRAASADIDHAGKALGYMPEVDVRSGLQLLLNWIQDIHDRN
ncbi:MAG: NAD-dependent epimerase/dehydratase family protein [Pseudonocardia sp.]|mgnify:FL=1|uniref:NAD-dependent epimerase/dehydratase family protein n=1 Tax=Pseudonocardia sp. TaxID=60912 RepID=UPI001AC09B32|nr:NAD-dependent epimerase/dehydratase family protein [Pseudonocardia sp.]MBN9100000.1 NAD-dependent epimerase/dehydratase family protein [Pseudonocardia sp.]